MTVRDNPDERRYEALVDDEVAGYLFYRAREGELVLIHTEVDEAFEGQGIGVASSPARSRTSARVASGSCRSARSSRPTSSAIPSTPT